MFKRWAQKKSPRKIENSWNDLIAMIAQGIPLQWNLIKANC